MNLKEIKEMISLMNDNDILEFQLEREGFKVMLKKSPSGGDVAVHTAPAATQTQPVPVAPASAPAEAPTDGLAEIVSPMVGTFYHASSPEAAPYVKKGDTVKEEDVVCIIEAMKVMNEIKAEVKGTIVEILVENGEAVEFGQPLFKVKKS